MAVFKNTIITDAGRKVLSDALANSKKIIFTKISTSNKEYQDSVDIAKIITLENVKQTTTLSNIRQEGTKITINAVFTNSSVETAYLINTIGLYAKVEDGVEILFSITRASTADTMPASNGINLSTVEIDLVTEINNADGATIEFNPSTLVTFSTLATTESPGITKYGTEESTALEGKELARILGVENYGGLVNTVGQKTVGKAYYDTTTKSMYICKQNNSNTYVDNNNYAAFSNSKLLDRLENLFTIEKLSIIQGKSINISDMRNNDIYFVYVQFPNTIAAAQFTMFANSTYNVSDSHANNLILRIDTSSKNLTLTTVSAYNTSFISQVYRMRLNI